jgi:hypothetical protein
MLEVMLCMFQCNGPLFAALEASAFGLSGIRGGESFCAARAEEVRLMRLLWGVLSRYPDG